jgi:cbb3-type cytochrome oxidase subunit 3
MVATTGGNHVTDQPTTPPTGRKPGPRGSPVRLVLPIVLGLIVGSIIYYGYIWFTHRQSGQQQPAEAQAGDADLDKPAADECAMAKAAATAVHAAGDDKRWEAGANVTSLSLGDHSKVVNPADFAGFSDDEAANLQAKAGADWRWCPGMSAFVSQLGWNAMGDDYPAATLALGRPALNKAGDEAKMWEAFLAEKPGGMLMVNKGPWLVTLKKGPNGAWQATSRDDLKKYYPSSTQ